MSLTKAQQEFFRDSKVRYLNGDLITVYHGAKTNEFDTFQYSPDRQTGTDFGEAYYFTTDYRSACTYAYDEFKDPDMAAWRREKDKLLQEYDGRPGYHEALDKLKINGKTGMEIANEADYTKTGGKVHAVYLNLKNPMYWNGEGKNYYDLYPKLFRLAQKYGHDGIIVRNVNDIARGEGRLTDVFIAFKPNQIKSIDNLFPTQSNNFKDNSREYFQENYRKMSPEDQFHMARVIKQQANRNQKQKSNNMER